jgi:Ca2+-binding RTX toxin-like protein
MYGVTASIAANNAGTAASAAASVSFAFASIEGFTGGAGDDAVVMGAGRTLSSTVIGGAGIDRLDYSAYVTSVRVDLTTGAAIGVAGNAAGGATGFEHVTGGSGADILIGDGAANRLIGNGGNDVLAGRGGADELTGGDGRDILIGGDGADALEGGLADDLLIAGSTAHDASIAALSALMAEWGRTDADYATRIAHLNGSLSGGRNGTRLLNATTVFNDAGAVDTLLGGAGLDWFIDFVGDLVNDLGTGGTETRTTL